MAPLRLLEFSSSNIIKAENFIAVLTFMSVSTLFWEWVTSDLTGLNINSISNFDILALFFITTGGLVISLTRKNAKKGGSKC